MEQTEKRFRKRSAILECLRSTDTHPSADWIFQQLKGEIPDLSLGTVYLVSTYTNLITCTSVDYPALIALYATPAAVSSAVMAGQMGNDEQLATQIVVWTSVCSVVTMFIIICCLIWTGLMIPI